MTATTRAWGQIVADLVTEAHPLWCHNRGEVDACRDADEDYRILHTRDSVYVPALNSTDRTPLDIGVSLFRAVRNDGPEEGAEIVIPGGHADLNRHQLRLLIAELTHLDQLWEL